MFSNLATKIALKKVGLPSNALDFSWVTGAGNEPKEEKPKRSSAGKNANKNLPPGTIAGLDDAEEKTSTWPAWMTVKNLPLTVQPWLSPPPPPIPVAESPKVGDLAPLDRDRKLALGGGRRVLVVFLRCVGCAFAQKTFLALRAIANRNGSTLTCIAVSHSSETATYKWLDMLGGAQNVQVVVDEDRAVYAAWGLGLGSVWYVLNPTTQVQSWKETGWLGDKVAGAVKRSQATADAAARMAGKPQHQQNYQTGGTGVVDAEGGPQTVMGNKWQQAGAWAVDGRGTVVWGRKALRADDMLDLDAGLAALGM